MENDDPVQQTEGSLEERKEEQRLVSRRDFLAGLRKWSAAVIGVAVAGSVLLPGETASGWVNSRGSWVNAHGGGGGWVNRGGSWINGGGGGWYNRGTAWANRGSAWANRAGAGGGAWVNRRGW